MGCTSCVENSQALKYYLKVYKQHGVESFVYRLSPKHSWQFMLKEGFKDYKKKLNRRKKAEFFHIKEFDK